MSRPADELLPAFFARAAGEHARTLASAGEVSRTICLGERAIRLRFAGRALADAITAAFAPRLVADDEPAEVTIGLWEESLVPGGPLALPWRAEEVGPRGLVRQRPDAPLAAVHEAGSGAVTLVDAAAGALLHRVSDVSALPWWERAAPLRPALFWAVSGQGRQLVHAGAVGDGSRGGVLLAGAGGSGKTTVALAAASAGMAYVADDYLLLQAQGEPVAWNLFGTAKLDAEHAARLPELAAAARISPRPEAGEKAVLDVEKVRPGAVVRSLPIRAVLLPRIRGGRARLHRASAAQALLALAPSTALQMPFDEGRVLGALGSLVRRVPAFYLDVGDDPGELAAAVDRVLDVSADIAGAGRDGADAGGAGGAGPRARAGGVVA